MEILKGRGVHDYGILRAWHGVGGGVTHFGISEGKGGVKTWKQSVVGYGYFLELPIVQSLGHFCMFTDKDYFVI